MASDIDKHDYKATDKIEMVVTTDDIAFEMRQTQTLEAWTGADDDDVDRMSRGEIETALQDAFEAFVFQGVEGGWHRKS